ncbi:hypothetical protein V2A60_007671 [Cordyceps javanica]
MNHHLLAFLAGTPLHLLVFSRGEWDCYARPIIIASVLLDLASAAVLHGKAPADSWWTCLGTCTTLGLAAMAGLWTSMLVYRAYFHALCRYPGPFAARLSNLHLSYLSRRLRLYEELQQLHDQYGDIVRLGPSTLFIRKPEAVQAVYGPKSKCYKGPWYEQSKPLTSLHTNRDEVAYGRQRRSWERGLNSAALRDYEPIVTKATQNLLDKIKASNGQAFDGSKWFSFFSFEIMGWMAFDQSWDVLTTGKPTYCMELITQSLKLIGILAHIPWFFVLMKQIPGLGATFKIFRKWLRSRLDEQIEKPRGSSRTLFAAIMNDYPDSNELTAKQRMLLEGDMFLILVAGSDTVAMSLQALFYELSINQDAQTKLREEVDAYFAEHDRPEPVLLAKLDHLQACINEAMRLWPPVMSGMQRTTPPEGLQVGDAFIPGNIHVQVPTYLIHRSEGAFSRPNDFVPERWTTKPELIVDRSAYYPFSVGRHSCPGKQFALVELRQAAVEILRRYTVELAPGFTSKDFEDGLKDHFNMEASRLDFAFTAR